MFVSASLLAAGVGTRYALRSRGTAEHAAQRLRQLLQVQVKVGQADVGLGHYSTLGQVEIFEEGAENDNGAGRPWLAARSVEADIGAADLLAEPTRPFTLKLRGVSVDLHFDASGRLRTRVPLLRGSTRAAPSVQLENGQITLHQDGRPPFVVQGIEATGASNADSYRLTGVIVDPYWGRWQAKIELDSSNRRVVLYLNTDQAEVTQEKLETLPFIRESVWKQVRLTGTTPVEFRLEFPLGSEQPAAVRYRVALRPIETQVHIAAIQLDADQAQGFVRVEDGRVEVQSVTGRTADGRIDCEANLDCRSVPSRMEFRIHVRELDVEKLPPNWTVAFLQGRLTGDAHLLLSSYPDRLETAGEGTGRLTSVRLGLLHLAPVQLHLVPERGRYRLTPVR